MNGFLKIFESKTLGRQVSIDYIIQVYTVLLNITPQNNKLDIDKMHLTYHLQPIRNEYLLGTFNLNIVNCRLLSAF